VYVIGKSLDRAKEVLERMNRNPTDNDKKLIEHHTNLRIDSVEDKDCWWNFGCD